MAEHELLVPDELGEDVVVLGWLRNDGDAVEQGEPLVELTVEKAQYELEAPASGILRHRAQEEQVLRAGALLAVIQT